MNIAHTLKFAVRIRSRRSPVGRWSCAVVVLTAMWAVLGLAPASRGDGVDLFIDFPEETTLSSIKLVEEGKFDEAIRLLTDVLADKSAERTKDQVEDLRIGLGLVHARCEMYQQASTYLQAARVLKDRPDRGRQVEMIKEVMLAKEYALPTSAEARKQREEDKKAGKPDDSPLNSREEWKNALIKYRRDRDKDLKKYYDTIDLYVKDANYPGIETQLEQARIRLERALAARVSEDGRTNTDFVQQHIDRVSAALDRLVKDKLPAHRRRYDECVAKGGARAGFNLEMEKLRNWSTTGEKARAEMTSHLNDVKREFRR